MRLDVYLTPSEIALGDLAERTAVVVDVLRATTSIVEALGAGARTIFPVASIEEALRLANTLGRDEVLLCGERKCLPIEGFDLGNSPREFTPERVAGKTLVMSTTNGTGTLMAAAGASRVLIASWLNLAAVVEDLRRDGTEPVILCAGRERQFGLEDAAFAGRVVQELLADRPDDAWQMGDGAMAALAIARAHPDPAQLFPRTFAGQTIADAGLGEDLAFCAQIDRYDILPVLQDRQITLSAPAAVSDA